MEQVQSGYPIAHYVYSLKGHWEGCHHQLDSLVHQPLDQMAHRRHFLLVRQTVVAHPYPPLLLQIVPSVYLRLGLTGRWADHSTEKDQFLELHP